MSMLTLARVVAFTLLLPAAAFAETLTVDEFRRELVGLPLCGTPTTGPLAGKALCTVHLPDGTAILAGSGLLVRGVWDVEDGHICRRNAHEPPERRRCVDYARSDAEHYHNSDGVEFCIGPCPVAPAPAGAASAPPAPPAAVESPAPAAAVSAEPPPGAEPAKP
jgi:hypothetical protein